MNLALSINHWYAHGGGPRDLYFLLQELLDRGHRCRVYTREWLGHSPPAGVELCTLQGSGLRAHAKAQRFQRNLLADLQARPVDAHIGFNKMPGLDIYFAGDSCFVHRARRERGDGYRRGARYRHFAERERAVFDPAAATEVLCLSENQKADYIACYGTPENRLHLLPLGVAPDRKLPEDAPERRRRKREELGLAEGEYTLLAVANHFHSKGLDRAITALAALCEEQPALKARLLVVGGDQPRAYQRLAQKLEVLGKVDFLGSRDDVVDIMQAADVLLHPARWESGGSVLIEAIAQGLPQITTDVCGYASEVLAARSGRILSSPFDQAVLDAGVKRFVDGIFRADCREAALLHARTEDFGGLYQRAAELVEALAGGAGSQMAD